MVGCEDQSLFFHVITILSTKTSFKQLSSEGYLIIFAVSPVCSPSRSSIITGMYPTTIGTQHMRLIKKIKIR